MGVSWGQNFKRVLSPVIGAFPSFEIFPIGERKGAALLGSWTVFGLNRPIVPFEWKGLRGMAPESDVGDEYELILEPRGHVQPDFI